MYDVIKYDDKVTNRGQITKRGVDIKVTLNVFVVSPSRRSIYVNTCGILAFIEVTNIEGIL